MTIDEQITDLYVNKGWGSGRIAKVVNRHKTTVEQRIDKLKIKRDTSGRGVQTWFPTEEEIQMIRKYFCFDGLEVSQIAELLSKEEHLIRKYIKKYKLVKAIFSKIANVNFKPRHFQNNILSTAESYFLGYFTGDGHIHKTGNWIAIYSTDTEIVNKLYKWYGDGKVSIKETGYKPLSTLYIGDRRIHRTFKDYGFTNRKSYDFEYPFHLQLDFSSYLRGLWDSDGTINKNRCQIALTGGNLNFFFQLQSLIYELVPNVSLISIYTTPAGVHKLTCCGNSAKALLKFMYNTGHYLYLERKQKRAKEILQLG